MLAIDKVKTAVQGVMGNKLLVLQKHEPEIFIGVGLVCFGGAIVTACTATLHIEDILDEHNERLEKIKSGETNPKLTEEYTPEKAMRDRTVLYIQTATKIGKKYVPTVTLAALGTVCILKAHNVMSTRNVALMAAYKASEEAYNAYRNRVKEELGEEKDEQFLYGYSVEETKEKVKDPETGKTKTVKKEEIVRKGDVANIYTRFFDESNPNWYDHPDKHVVAEQNKFFLLTTLDRLNNRMISMGHIMANEVWEALGMDHCPSGAVVGKLWDPAHGYDELLDFGIFDDDNEIKRMFVNGDETSIMINPNFDGVIYDLI